MPSRSRPPREAPVLRRADTRPARDCRRGRHQPARHDVRVARTAAHVNRAADAPTRCAPRARCAVDHRSPTTAADGSTWAAVRPAAVPAGTALRNRLRHRHCADLRQNWPGRSADLGRGASRSGSPTVRPGWPRSAPLRGSATGAVPTRRKPGARPPSPRAPPRRTARCCVDSSPSTCCCRPAARADRNRSRSSRGSGVSTA